VVYPSALWGQRPAFELRTRTLNKQEFIDKFGEETLKQVNKASGREETRRIDRELYQLLIENREKNAMIPRIRECAKSQAGGKIAVGVGSEHLYGLV
jgi:uncharacterized protein YbaP (TraB family)